MIPVNRHSTHLPSPSATADPRPPSPRSGHEPGATTRTAGPDEGTPSADSALALRTVMLLQKLLEKVVGDRIDGDREPPPPPQRSYTPRSDAPLTRLASIASMPTRLRWRTLHFSCPCCGRETVVVRRQAGHRIRCPHCHSAVGAPHPAHRRSAHNLERDIESLLRPQTFSNPIHPVAPRWVRLIEKEPVLILALGALIPFTILLMIEVPQALEKARGGVPTSLVQAAPAAPAAPPRGPADGAADRAVALVRSYLAAPTPLAKAAYIRDPRRVAPLLVAMAARQPELQRAVTDAVVQAAGLSHYADPANPLPVSPVVARFADGTSRTFFVEHAPQGDAIEWESSTAYSEPLRPARVKGRPAGSTTAKWRVEAAPDDYFNRAFADADGLICLKLSRPDRPDETFWAYAPKDSAVGETLRQIWNESPRERVQRLTVTVDADPSASVTRQLRLAAVHHAGWRTPDGPGVLVAGHP